MSCMRVMSSLWCILVACSSGSASEGGNLEITTPATLTVSCKQNMVNYQFQAAGGEQPYAWSLPVYVPPTGLSFSSNGTLSGTLPDQNIFCDEGAAWEPTVEVQDKSGLEAVSSVSISFRSMP